MEGVTLLESGTTRAHFALVKRLEMAENTMLADKAIDGAVESIRSSLQAKDTSSFAPATLSSHFVVLLHCISQHATASRISLEFALVPALHLLATATTARQLHLAHLTFRHIILTGRQDEAGAVDVSLLLLNTFRSHLLAMQPKATSSSSSVRKGNDIDVEQGRSLDKRDLKYAQTYFALSSILASLPSGADVVPALFGPTLALVDHHDAKISALAMDALATLELYVKEDESFAIAAWQKSKAVIGAKFSVADVEESESCDGTLTSKTRRGGTSSGSGSLVLSCLRAITRASKRGYWSVDKSLGVLRTILVRLVEEGASHALVRASCDTIALVAARGRPSCDVLRLVADALVDAFASCQGTYSTALAIVRTLASVQKRAESLESSHTILVKNLDIIWDATRSHLSTKNANRKVLLLGLLDALLALGSLEEANGFGADEVTRIVALLGDQDSTVRRSTLSLLKQIDEDLLLQHQESLLAVLEAASTWPDKVDLGIRWIETVHERMRHSKRGSFAGGKGFGAALVDLVSHFSQFDGVEESIVMVILSLLRTSPPPFARFSLHPFIFRLQEDFPASVSSPTAVMLIASLVCEFVDPSNEEHGQGRAEKEEELDAPTSKRIDQRMLDKLTSILATTSSPALQEALLVAIGRVAMIVLDILPSSVATVRKVLENASSRLVQVRAEQVIAIASEPQRSTLIPLERCSTLTETLDAIDRYFASLSTTKVVGNTGRSSNDLPSTSVRPLRYDAYDDTASTSSATPVAKASPQMRNSSRGHHTMPKPSEERQRLQAMTQREAKAKSDMEASLRRLMLGPSDETEAQAQLGKDQIREQESLILFDADQPSSASQQ